jgi:iron complex transport system ATP-binding protein
VQDLDLILEPGSLTILLGPNGSGKTTTLRLGAGLLRPTAGSVRYAGRELTQWRRNEPRKIAQQFAYVPQSAQSPFDFTVRQLVAMARYPHHGRLANHDEVDHARVDSALERLGLGDLQHRLARTLSGGELQRVQLARCLAGEAAVLLLDEPTSNLDLAHALEVLEICSQLAREGQLVLVTLHDVAAARRFADRVVLLRQGRLVADGAPPEVLDPAHIREVFGVAATELSDGERTAYWFQRLAETDDEA